MMSRGENHVTQLFSSVTVQSSVYPTPDARVFVVDTPTTIYGIAGSFWRQNEVRSNLRVLLLSAQKRYRNITFLKSVKWSDTLPMKYVLYTAELCGVPFPFPFPNDTAKYLEDYVPTYEFYFDTPVVVTDTFLVGIQSLGNDGELHLMPGVINYDSTNIVYLVQQRTCCDRSYQKPDWLSLGQYLHVQDSFKYNDYSGLAWGGLFPIISAPCVYDTLTCANVRDFDVRVREDGEVELLWYADEVHPRYQVSVGPEGSDPDTCAIYEVEGSPYVIPGVWDTAVRYEVHIRALCEKECGGEDTTVWSEWSWPVYFGVQRGQPSGVEETGGEGRFVLSPNPARGTVAVTLAEPMSKAVELTVRDASGRKVRSMTFAGQSAMVDISGLAAGSYIVTLVTADGEATSRRLVVE